MRKLPYLIIIVWLISRPMFNIDTFSLRHCLHHMQLGMHVQILLLLLFTFIVDIISFIQCFIHFY